MNSSAPYYPKNTAPIVVLLIFAAIIFMQQKPAPTNLYSPNPYVL